MLDVHDYTHGVRFLNAKPAPLQRRGPDLLVLPHRQDLLQACGIGDTVKVQRFLQGISIATHAPSALRRACRCRPTADAMCVLLHAFASHAADPPARPMQGLSPQMISAMLGRAHCVELLLAAEASKSARDEPRRQHRSRHRGRDWQSASRRCGVVGGGCAQLPCLRRSPAVGATAGRLPREWIYLPFIVLYMPPPIASARQDRVAPVGYFFRLFFCFALVDSLLTCRSAAATTRQRSSTSSRPSRSHLDCT